MQIQLRSGAHLAPRRCREGRGVEPLDEGLQLQRGDRAQGPDGLGDDLALDALRLVVNLGHPPGLLQISSDESYSIHIIFNFQKKM